MESRTKFSTNCNTQYVAICWKFSSPFHY